MGRNVKFGGDASGNVVVTGDKSLISASLSLTTNSDTVDVAGVLRSVREILETLQTADSRKIENALSDAEVEIAKPVPDREEVGQSLQRALTYAKNASRFGEIAATLAPYIQRLAFWLGEGWAHLAS
jgi:hypothetical protein